MHVDLLHQGDSLATSFQYTLPSEYGWVLIIATVLAVELLFIGFAAGGKRTEFFSEDFMKENFGEEHRKATETDITKGGYPDSGNGRYS